MIFNFSLIPLADLVPLVLIALGGSYVITGSTIGYPLRWLAYKTLGWIGREPVWADSLVRCPYCHAWWEGLFWAWVTGHSWIEAIQVAFATCVLAAIVQAQWSLAAGAEKYTREG